MDVLFEENDSTIQNYFQGKTIYEWNIDVCTDKQIHDQLHRMMIYS